MWKWSHNVTSSFTKRLWGSRDLVRVVGGLPPEGVVASSGETVVARCKLPPQLHRQKHPTHLLRENLPIGEKSMVFQLIRKWKLNARGRRRKSTMWIWKLGRIRWNPCSKEFIDLYITKWENSSPKWRIPGSGMYRPRKWKLDRQLQD